jgi:transcriptional regulator GlxA family with amidase domain
LLRTTALSVGDIAVAVGFCDHSHLVRQMRRVLGVTPTSVRERRY